MNKKVLVTVGVIVLVILLGCVGFLIYKLNDANKEREDILEQFSYEREQMEQNKSQLEQDYVTLSNDLEGFSLKVNNDSILKKLNDEQKRVQLLLEELRTTKATNVKRINVNTVDKKRDIRKILIKNTRLQSDTGLASGYPKQSAGNFPCPMKYQRRNCQKPAYSPADKKEKARTKV